MYSTYSSDDAFERMLEKKKLQARFLFPHSPLPKGVTQSQVKTMIKYLNKNPSQREKISAAKEVDFQYIRVKNTRIKNGISDFERVFLRRKKVGSFNKY